MHLLTLRRLIQTREAPKFETNQGTKMANLYHIYLIPSQQVSDLQIKKTMDLALDWLKYSVDCWLVWTTSDKAKLKARFGPLAKPDGKLLIVKVDPSEYGGFAGKETWDWLGKYAGGVDAIKQ